MCEQKRSSILRVSLCFIFNHTFINFTNPEQHYTLITSNRVLALILQFPLWIDSKAVAMAGGCIKAEGWIQKYYNQNIASYSQIITVVVELVVLESG